MPVVPKCDAPGCSKTARFELRSTFQLYERNSKGENDSKGENVDSDGSTTILHGCELEHLDQVADEHRRKFLDRFTPEGKDKRTSKT